jgi:outer membrane protein OmpA-like peptidoglycan-associated protein
MNVLGYPRRSVADRASDVSATFDAITDRAFITGHEEIRMHHNIRNFASLLAGILASAVVAATAVHAAEMRGKTPGYPQDSSENVVRTGSGDCLHSGSWTPGMANVVGCDGVTLTPVVEVIKGAPSGLIGAVAIPDAALFAFDSAELTAAGKNTIEEYRKQLRPDIATAYAGIIIGHTDSTGTPEYNMQLSKRRAQAVADYLMSTGVDPKKLRVIGRGKNDPVAPNDTPENRAKNRRVDVVVIAEPRALDTMRFPSVALFPRRSAEITEQGKQTLEKNRTVAQDMLSRATYIEVVGNTDDVGDDAYNMELSEQRAKAVRDYLVSNMGVDPSKIVTIGAGETNPVASNTTDEGRAQNRRVDVLVLGRLK